MNEKRTQLWGTLEELLLACAVNRHGTRSWESIAMEVQNRSSNLPALTSQHCRDKFIDLKRRFMAKNDPASGSLVPMVDELRRIRVEELRREVERRDVSIVSLEKKVKRLEEERERSLKEEADLMNNLEREEGETNPSPVTLAEKSISGDGSDFPENRSFNASNSTGHKAEILQNDVVNEQQLKPERLEPTVVEPDPARPVSDANRESFNGKIVDDDDKKMVSKEEIRADPIQHVESNELWESVGESKRELKDLKDGALASKQSSDVQSSASLSKKKRRRRGGAAVSSSGEGPEGEEVSPSTKRAWAVKSEPLVNVLEIIRSHKLGSTFERRLLSQESERYKNLIRQHVDLRTIQSRLDKGLYSNFFQRFFRDLLHLFTNAIVFFRKNSPEHAAAHELRALVLKEIAADMQRRSQQPDTNPSNMVVCRKRSSIKALSENASRRGDKREMKKVEQKSKVDQRKKDYIEEKNAKKKGPKDQRLIFNKKEKSGESKHEYGGNELSSHDYPLEIKMDKKESVVIKKKQGAASFLKRMKQNSSSDTEEDNLGTCASEDESKDSSKEEEDEKKRRGSNIIRNGRKRDRVTRSSVGRGTREESEKLKRGVGRPPKRQPASTRESLRGNKRSRRDGGESEALVVGGVGRARKSSRR